MLNVYAVSILHLEGPLEGLRSVFATYRDETLPSGFMPGEEYRQHAAYMVRVERVILCRERVAPVDVRAALAEVRAEWAGVAA